MAVLHDRLNKNHTTQSQDRISFIYQLYRETPHPILQPSPPKQMQALTFSNMRNKMYVQIDNSIVVMDNEFAEMVRGKLGGLWMPQVGLRADMNGFEVEGMRMRMGSLIQGGVSKGVIVEVEYFACAYLEEGAPIVREIMRSIVGETMKQLNIAPERVRYYGDPKPGVTTTEAFTNLDTGKQYMELLRMRREDGRPL